MSTRQKVLELYDNGNGIGCPEIAKMLNITPSGVYYHLRKAGIPIVNKNYRNDIDMEWVRQQYDSGRSYANIAKELKYDRELLRRRMDRAGIERRTDWRQHLPKGEENCQYKDGKGQERNRARDKRDPRRTSWQIAAICLGHPLPRYWIVHHHDENPNNNNWQNLWIFPSWHEHGRYHGRLSYLRYAEIEVDANQLALENGGLPLPPPPAPILSARDKDRPALWEKLQSQSQGQANS